MSTEALPQQAQAAQVTTAGEQGPEVPTQASEVAPHAPEATPQVVVEPQATPGAVEDGASQDPVANTAPAAAPEQDATPTPDAGAAGTEPEHADNLETRTAARLQQLMASGAEKLPGEAGSTVSRVAVALLSFGSEAAAKDKEKSTSTLVGEAVGLFRSLDDDDPAKQRGALENALERFTTSALGGKERSQVLEVAEEAMGLWAKLRGTSHDLAKTDAAVSMRSLSSALRKEGRDDEAEETENEAKRLES